MKLQPVDIKGQGLYESEEGGMERGRSIGRPQVCEEGGGQCRASVGGERGCQHVGRGGYSVPHEGTPVCGYIQKGRSAEGVPGEHGYCNIAFNGCMTVGISWSVPFLLHLPWRGGYVYRRH